MTDYIVNLLDVRIFVYLRLIVRVIIITEDPHSDCFCMTFDILIRVFTYLEIFYI